MSPLVSYRLDTCKLSFRPGFGSSGKDSVNLIDWLVMCFAHIEENTAKVWVVTLKVLLSNETQNYVESEVHDIYKRCLSRRVPA